MQLRHLLLFPVIGMLLFELVQLRLEHLHLADISVDLSGLSRFKRLWNLGIQGAGFGSDLSFLKWTPTIGGLDVRFSGLETSDLSQLDHCPNLVALVLGYNKGIGPDLSTLAGRFNMAVLNLSTTGADLLSVIVMV